MRIGRIPYINCYPVYGAIDRGIVTLDGTLVDGIPSALNHQMADGSLDVSVVSAVEYARDSRRYLLLPDLAISCDGPVRSVMLFSKRPARELSGHRVIVSRSSMTSVALVELLAENVWRVRPEFVPGNSELADIARFGEEEHEARLVIGDAALILNDARHGVGEGTQATYPYVYDLGSEWKAWTGLPFVFAVWVAQRTTPVAPALSAHASLIASRDWGLAHLDELAEQATRVTGVARAACVDYFQGLDYGLGYEHLAGLTEFFRRLVAAGRVPNGSLAFLPAA
ncbi:MAG: menaquinone biosynthesis protein [Gemmatimonadetes bacterium]|nr:menaquinone biosynthesis protein [Gemmatimonadota bacterium]HNV73503.1 menaquinone biosynthesis protein [Gemmatimonadaceae bacterium]MBK6456513.1 menaquinone biosynthesis protein [Gemmatimonadota bacterium]MBK6842038.1 menaquinone biosynthesis protein [Gemmatimonadota bacterium]MBK7835743.1 menaquinone biosynthesis protein [Gemmatimonadota bacterium]